MLSNSSQSETSTSNKLVWRQPVNRTLVALHLGMGLGLNLEERDAVLDLPVEQWPAGLEDRLFKDFEPEYRTEVLEFLDRARNKEDKG